MAFVYIRRYEQPTHPLCVACGALIGYKEMLGYRTTVIRDQRGMDTKSSVMWGSFYRASESRCHNRPLNFQLAYLIRLISTVTKNGQYTRQRKVLLINCPGLVATLQRMAGLYVFQQTRARFFSTMYQRRLF